MLIDKGVVSGVSNGNPFDLLPVFHYQLNITFPH